MIFTFNTLILKLLLHHTEMTREESEYTFINEMKCSPLTTCTTNKQILQQRQHPKRSIVYNSDILHVQSSLTVTLLSSRITWLQNLELWSQYRESNKNQSGFFFFGHKSWLLLEQQNWDLPILLWQVLSEKCRLSQLEFYLCVGILAIKKFS